MKPPPFLLGAALLFWGWQAELLAVGAGLAVVLESAVLGKARWEFSDDDFRRMWTFCSVLLLGALVYAFTANEGPATFGGFFDNPTAATQGAAGLSSARTAAAVFRWLPMILFPFLAAQTFSTRDAIPLSAISWILRRRQLRAKKAGRVPAPERHFHAGFPYFVVCLIGASVHPAENTTFFWGLGALLTWALWSRRSRRFHFAVWMGALAAAMALGYYGQRGIWQIQRQLQNLNVQWLARLRFNRSGSDPTQSRTAFGRVGDLKLSSRIVVRLEPLSGGEPPSYLREASYRVFRAHTWFAGSSRDDFVSVPETPMDSGIWPLLPAKTNTAAAVRIAGYLNDRKEGTRAGLLPLPGGSARLERLRAFTVERNSAGAVLATGPGLVIFDALYGPGATLDSPGGAGEDLDVPAREQPALDQVIGSLGLKGESPEQAMRTLAAFFEDDFTYRTWQDVGRGQGTNATPLSRFLLETRAGHCEYFATAATLLLRQLGIPARYAVGYVVHERSGRDYVVRLWDAHAWCLAWDAASQTWRDFETTPAAWIAAESGRMSPFRWLADAWGRLRFEWSRIWWGETRLRQYVLLALAPVLLLLLFQIFFRRGRGRGGAKTREEAVPAWPGRDSEFYWLEELLAKRGVPRDPGETIGDWLLRATKPPKLAAWRQPLLELLRLHYRYRFDPLGLGPGERQALRREAQACLATLTAGGDRSSAFRDE